MNKKSISKILTFCTLFFYSFFLYGESSSPENTVFSKEKDFLYSYQLENGFQIFFLEDLENPLLRITYISKAGYSIQNKENSGFPELAKNLFFQNCNLPKPKEIGLTSLSSDFKSDTAIFQGVTTINNLEKALEYFSVAAQNPTFKDEILQTEYLSLKNRTLENYNNELAYINSSIDSVIFTSPWKQDTVLYEGIINKYKTEEIRNKVLEIYNQFYTPDKSCIFITGAANPEKILEYGKKYFSNWNKSIYNIIIDNQSINNPPEKKYVLVSENFSTDYNQVIIQYPNKGLFSDIKSCGTLQLASLCLENSPIFKEKVVNQTSGIYDETYIYSGFSENGSSSRVIIQSLMENKEFSPYLQVENIIENIKVENSINEEIFQKEQKKFLSQNITSRIETKKLYDALISTWGYGGTDYFYNYMNNVKSLTLKDIKSVFENEPFVFLLINSKTYITHKESLLQNGYKVLSQNNIAFQQKEKNNTELKPLESIFYEENINSFETYKLKNQILVIEKKTKKQEGFTLHLSIKGGELLNCENPGLETIAIKYFAKNIDNFLKNKELSSDYSIETETGLYNSSISITVAKNDAGKLLDSVKTALYYSELTAAQGDELIFTENYNFRLWAASPSNQLFSSAMETIFSGTDLESLFEPKDALLANIDFTQVFKAYTDLLDSSRFSVIALGNIPENLVDLLNITFGDLHSVNLASSLDKSQPIVSNSTRFIQLKRIFTTDIKAEDAGPRPAKLIPTTVFTDPVDFYFETPNKFSIEYEVFKALLYEFEKKLNENWEKGVKVSLHESYSDINIARIEFTGVETKKLSSIRGIFENTLKEFIENVKTEGANNLEGYKNQYIIKNYNFENIYTDTGKLIEKGLLLHNNPTYYLECYKFIMNSSIEDYLEAIRFFENITFLEVRPKI